MFSRSIVIIVCAALSLTGCASSRHSRYRSPEIDSVVYRPAGQANTAPSPVATSFAWPLKGQVISSFGDRDGDFRNKGIDIRAAEGVAVRAAGDGKVVYCDAKMRGFGKTVIVDHGNALQSVYSYNSEIMVGIGDVVRKGEVIAKAGSTGRARESSLHFEIRKDGEPMNPLAFLK